MSTQYTLTRQSLRQVGDATRRVLRRPIAGGPRDRGHYLPGGGGLIQARSSGTIPGATTSGTTITPGQGQAKIYRLDGDDLVLGDADRDVFTALGDDIPAGRFLLLYRFNGRLWVAGWEC